MKEDAKFLDAIKEIRSSADVKQFPDERLLDACDRFNDLWNHVDQLHRLKPKGYLAIAKETSAERDALMQEITNTPARTGLGRDAKGSAAIRIVKYSGTAAMLVESALADFMTFDQRRHRGGPMPRDVP